MKHAVRHIHFVGIGGAGMSGIAEVLQQQGYAVSGSDMQDGATLARLAGLGIRTHVGHEASQIGDADVLVTSSAVRPDNPEVRQALASGITVIPRATMLAELMRNRRGIAVAGTHGKTTTTALVTSVLAEGGLDPGFVIGGTLHSAGANAGNGSGDWMVVEADESDASFLKLLPVMAVVTNIDADHMETYGHAFSRLQDAFVEFVQRLPFYGQAIVCADDPGVRSVMGRLTRPVISYGTSPDAAIQALELQPDGQRMHFRVRRRNPDKLPDLPLTLNLAGRHNVLNALAAVAVAMVLGIPDPALQRALAGFQGVGRRFQSHGEIPVAGGGHFSVFEDYGHHPVEIEATLSAARGAFAGRRLVLAFQPHRYSRTRDCLGDFARVLRLCDLLLLTDVYAAGEDPIPGADGPALARAVGQVGGAEPVYVASIDDMPDAILRQARAGDVVLCMGAGSIGGVAARLRATADEGMPA